MIPECSCAALTVGLQCSTTNKLDQLMVPTRPRTGHNSSEEDAVMSYGRSKDGCILLEVCENVACASGHACGAQVNQGTSANFCDSRDRNRTEEYNNTAGQAMAAPSKPGGGAKRGGRPVTWIGGGGLDPKKLAGLGVPMLRSLFNQVFGEPTASNNAGWLRRKLSESPDSVHGQRRSAVVRARDFGAAIWNSSLPLVTSGGCGDDGGDVMDCDVGVAQEHTSADEAATAAGSELLVHSACDVGGRCSLKRPAASAESADTLSYRGIGNNMHCPSSPSGSGSATPTGTQHGTLPGSCSTSPHGPNRFSTKPHKHFSQPHHKHHNKGMSKQYSQYQTQQQQGCQAGCVGLVIRPETFSDSHLGLKVMVYWPQDHKWWEATICKLNTAACELQLLYSDMTEEAVSGSDFIDLLTKGHLALAAGLVPPSAAAPAPAACTTAAMGVSCAQALVDTVDVSWLDCGGTSLATGVRSQSCLLPTSMRDSAPAPAPIVRSASASFTGDAGSGSGSGEASATLGGDFEELAAKRQCFEATDNAGSGAGSGSYDNRDGPDSFGGFFPAASNTAYGQSSQQQQVPQGPDASNLGAWFHAQQQQQLQMQMQAQQQNMQLQQQMHMQMQQQMAAHMAMQQAAAAMGQFVQLQAGCAGVGVSVPMCLVPTAAQVPAAAAACSGPLLTAQPSLPSPVASALVASQQPPQQQQRGGSSLAAGNSNLMLANDIEQLRQLQQRLRLAVSSSLPDATTPRWQPAADQCMAAVPAAVACPGTIQQQQQQEEEQVAIQYTTRPVVPSIKVEDPSVIPDQCVEGQRRGSTSCDAAVVPDNSTAAPPLPAAEVQSCPSNEQRMVTDGNDIDCLLSKPGDTFDLSALETEQNAELEAQIGDVNASNDAMDLPKGDMDVSDPSNSCNDSLCESLADELAVAGLDPEAATAYYTYNMFEENTAEEQGLDSMQSQDSEGLDILQQGLGSVQSQNCLTGLKVQAGGFEPQVAGGQGSAGVESEFAHIFDD